MGIHDDDLEKVRRDSDIVQVVSGYTQLKRSGNRFSGLCPFHTERSGSFSVNSEQNLYYCFGCQAKGDVITFVREKEGLDFVGAVEWLAAKMGLQLRYTDANQGRERHRRAKLSELIGEAAEWYHQLLLTSPEAAPARAYLRQRGLNGELVRQFGVGWAPDDWDALAKHLGASDADLVESGLGLINRRNRQQDWFRARILFPIADAQGNPVGFGGRVMPGAEGAKYINSKDSEVYNKSRVLYGLDKAKSSIVNEGEVVICEGYTDVIGYHIAGVPRAVATCGTALTEEHVKLLKKFGNRVVLSFDADNAGQAAAEKFYKWERDHGLDVRVADLPRGADPGDLALTDPVRLAAAVTEARPFLEFRVQRVLRAAASDSVEGRARGAEDALAVVAQHPDPLVQDAYALQIADHSRMPLDTIRTMLRQANSGAYANRRGSGAQSGGGQSGSSASRGNRRIANEAPGQSGGPGFGGAGTDNNRRGGDGGTGGGVGRGQISELDMEALRAVANAPEVISELVIPELLSTEFASEVFALLAHHRDVGAAVEAADPEATELLYRLAVESFDSDPIDVASLLWGRFIGKQLDERIRAPRTADGGQLAVLTTEIRWFHDMKAALRQPDTKELTVRQLLAWVGSPSEEVE